MPIKKTIQKYVTLKIVSGDWKKGEKVASENQLAIQFHCSRMTARNSLQELSSSGLLKAVQGKGYIVSDIADDLMLRSWASEHGATHTTLDVIPTADIDKTLLIKFSLENENVIAFIKKYFIENEMLAMQITFLNKGIVWKANYDGFRTSITKELLAQGIVIERNENQFRFIEPHELFSEHLRDLNVSGTPLVEEIKSDNNYGWIERSLRITNSKYFKISFIRNRF